jgi:hypothetical protein
VLDREAGEHFLRSRAGPFPGQMIAELYGIEAGPLREEIDRNICTSTETTYARPAPPGEPLLTPPRAADRWRPVTSSASSASLWAAGRRRVRVVEALAPSPTRP